MTMETYNPLPEVVARWEQVREGLLNTIRSFSLRELNNAPGGRAATVRQLANHLWAMEAWMIERIARAARGEPDLARDAAEITLPDVLGAPMGNVLQHTHFALGDQSESVGTIITRLDAVREASRLVLADLPADGYFIPIVETTDDNHTVGDILNHLIHHEYIHIGGILCIRATLQKPD